MANRIITATVAGENIKLSSKKAGTKGSLKAVSIAFTFDNAWEGTTKKVYFFNIYGKASGVDLRLSSPLFLASFTHASV